MGFVALLDKCNRLAVTKFGNVTASITLAGVVVKTIPGIFDEAAEIVSPFDSERSIVKPVLVVESVDLFGITSDHVIEINNVEHKFDGKPKVEKGLTTVYLGVKK